RGSRDRPKKNDQTECPQRYAAHHIAHPTVRTVVQFMSQLYCGPAPHLDGISAHQTGFDQ
ncbi:MAG: hypothetical protein WB368_10080, partial [Candidatus Sulfotelmatobacter sp.]